MSQARSLILALLLAFMLPETIAAADPPAVSPESVTWTVAGAFSFEKKPAKTRESLSGIACPPPSKSPRHCIAAFDGHRGPLRDGRQGHLRAWSDRIVLLAGGKELDAEGAARDGDAVYITGSQSPFRSPCAPRPDSRHVFRFKVDQQTGKATLAASGKPIDLEDDRGNLWKYMNKNDILDKFVGNKKCLGKPDHAVNIEGLSAKDGILYFGFREPARDQHTYILPVKADELFSQAGIKNAEPIKIKVGSGSGIRDMLAVRDGFLLLIGPDDDNASGAGWSIALWDGSASKDPTPLAALNLSGVQPRPCSSGGSTDRKPEAMTVLEEGADFYRLLILSDGMCDGGPMSFRVQK